MTESKPRLWNVKVAVIAFAWIQVLQVLAASDLIWETGPGYRFALLPPAKGSGPGFTLLDPRQTGITFSNLLTDATVAKNRLHEIGSGVALGDIDGDGLVDIYFCNIEGANVLYRNLGNWRFEDITVAAGLVCSNQFSTGCVFADVDGDGHLDLLLNSLGGGTRLFLNDGKGHFTEKLDSGLLRRFGATSMALADVDGDGTLDLYVCNYRADAIGDHPPGVKVDVRQAADGTVSVEPKGRFAVLPSSDGTPLVIERGEPSFLYLNRGAGHFLPVPWHTGLFVDEDGLTLPDAPTDWGLSETGATGPTGNRYGDAAGHSCMAVAGPAQSVEKSAKVFGLSDTAKHALRTRVHGPRAGGGTFLAQFSTKDGMNVQLLTNTWN